MIEFMDFVPEMVAPPRYLKDAKFESLHAALQDCNAWIASNDVEVVNVETVVLPNIHHPDEEGSMDTDLEQDDEFVSTRWHQFVRLWYRKR